MLEPYELEEIRQKYEQLIGNLNSLKAADIEKAIDAGLEASAILDAIEQTAMARRPSHYYLRAVLQRYQLNGIRSAAIAEEHRKQRTRERAIANARRWASWYESPEDPADW